MFNCYAIGIHGVVKGVNLRGFRLAALILEVVNGVVYKLVAPENKTILKHYLCLLAIGLHEVVSGLNFELFDLAMLQLVNGLMNKEVSEFSHGNACYTYMDLKLDYI